LRELLQILSKIPAHSAGKLLNFCEPIKNVYEKTVTVREFRLGKSILEKFEGRIKKGGKNLAL